APPQSTIARCWCLSASASPGRRSSSTTRCWPASSSSWPRSATRSMQAAGSSSHCATTGSRAPISRAPSAASSPWSRRPPRLPSRLAIISTEDNAMLSRRTVLISGAAAVAGAAAVSRAQDSTPEPPAPGAGPRAPVTVPNGSMLPWNLVNGVKVFHLVAQPFTHEFAPGLRAECWGYNGTTPGPLIEAVEGDRVRIYVTNRLPEATAVHWHGLFVPNGMDGVAGLTQPGIPPGETFRYEFTLRQSGTFMYHP